MKKLILCIVVILVAALSGCSGGGGSSGSDPGRVYGIAASGAPIAGTVFLKDASGQEFSTPIGADGSYAFDVTTFTEPFILKAVGTADGQSCTLYSLASTAGIANINPLSHLATVLGNGGADPSSLYINLTASRLKTITGALATVIPQIQELLQPILSRYDAPAANFITTPYTSNHLGLDLLFDTIAISTSGGNLRMTNKANGALILTSPLNGTALSGQVITADIPVIATKPAGSVFVYPVTATVLTGSTIQFRSIVKGMSSQAVIWGVAEAAGGTISSAGFYTAPTQSGTYHVAAVNAADPTKSATASIRVLNPTYVHLQSDIGDYIGGGLTYSYTNANAQIVVSATGGYLSVTVRGDQEWWGEFKLPANLTQLQPGTYSNLQRFPFFTPGLSWQGEGRGSNTLTGTLTIDNAVYVNGALSEIDLNFEQHSEGGVPALHGQIHWTAIDTALPPGPVNPPSAGLWRADAGATPLAGNYVYLQSDSGDYVGGGLNYSYTDGEMSVTSSGGGIRVGIQSNHDNWSGNFLPMNSISQLQPGYYADLQRYPFHNPVKGGLAWGGNGRGCNTLSGWFVVDAVSYVNGALSALDLRFEQHCEGAAPALHGQIHWRQ